MNVTSAHSSSRGITSGTVEIFSMETLMLYAYAKLLDFVIFQASMLETTA